MISTDYPLLNIAAMYDTDVLPAQTEPATNDLSTLLAKVGPLPHGALFLGVADDSLPLLLNLYDPAAGPVLIAGDARSGKTSLLETIAHAAEQTHTPAELHMAIVTSKLDEWISRKLNQTRAGIYHVRDAATPQLLLSLVTWAHNNKGQDQSILLLIDGLESFASSDEQSAQHLRWLLLRGPSRRVWPIISLEADHALELAEWMEFFRTRLIGAIRNARTAEFVAGDSRPALDQSDSIHRFWLREGLEWIRFCAPATFNLRKD